MRNIRFRVNKYYSQIYLKVILTFLLSLLALVSEAYAGLALWTLTPTSDSNPNQVVSRNQTTTVSYIVENQSYRAHNLMLLDTPGLTQKTSCNLTPRGYNDSICILNITINGSELPVDGLEEGPFLCQTNPDNTADPFQCYQPSEANVLHITIDEDK